MSTTARSPWLLTTWAAGLVGVAGVALAGAWPGWRPVAILLLAAIAPMLLLRAALSLRVSRWATTTVLALLLVLTAYLMSARSGTSLTGTVTDAVPLLLTSPQPYPLDAHLLVPPVLLTGLVSLFAGLTADTRSRVGPVAGAAVLYAAGALLTTGGSDPWGLLAVLVVVLAVLGWVLLDEHTEPTGRRFVVAAPGLVVLVGALAAAALLPATSPFDPRTVVDPPVTVVETSSPLPQLGAWAANPDAELLRVTGDDVPLRLVTLDEYDGSQWRAATRYAPLGTVSAAPLTGERRRTSTVSVALTGLGGHWLPSPGDPTSVSAPGAVVDTATGTLYDPEADAHTTYDVTGVVDLPDPADLIGATVPTSGPALRYVEQPDLPAELADYAAKVTPDAAPYQQALAIEAAVREGRRLSPRAISGSAFWRIERFLLGSGPGARVGTSEQFATAFAILARQAGLPTRVVVGFRPGHRQPDGTRVVRGRDALAWPEVYFQRLGWVPFAPTPNDDTFTRGHADLGDAPAADRGPATEPPEPTPTPEPVAAAADPP
ncbi:transglutaminaseTgpA domain-containing protein, partial [Nocardioides aquiterrae]|uniref:transglutaminase family protein n=1 Tax=Nocardioides aquiterrae TaxID=203799 RepID=UPI0031D81AF3